MGVGKGGSPGLSMLMTGLCLIASGALTAIAWLTYAKNPADGYGAWLAGMLILAGTVLWLLFVVSSTVRSRRYKVPDRFGKRRHP